MTSKFSNKYPIPEKFPEILHDFIREVIRYMPKDILDFAIQYFYSLEQNISLKYEEGGCNNIPKISYALEQKEKINKRENTPSLPTKQNTQNVFYNKNEINNIKNDIEIDEIKENLSKNYTPRGTEENGNELEIDNIENISNRTGNTFNNISGSSSIKNGVRNFIGDVLEESKKYVIETKEKMDI